MRGPYLFVGERPSQRAVTIGATWQSGGLAARTLRAALEAVGLEPGAQAYCNLFGLGPEATPTDRAYQEATLETIRGYAARGYTVVAMGRKVEAVLARAGVAHRFLIHPAARGAIRKTETYRAHVAEVLT